VDEVVVHRTFPVLFVQEGPDTLAVADIDADGDPDLVAGSLGIGMKTVMTILPWHAATLICLCYCKLRRTRLRRLFSNP
jgi:hypothetical protein